MFDLYELEEQTKFGRVGKIKFDKTQITTPINSPTNKEFEYMHKSPHVDSDREKEFDLGVQEEWFYEDRIERWEKGGNTREHMIDYIKRKSSDLKSDINLLNIRFGSDVDTIQEDILTSMLELQRNLNVDVIQTPIPNTSNFEEILDTTINWRKEENIDKPIMGMIKDMESIDILSNYKEDEKIDCYGLYSRYPSVPLLERLKSELEEENTWIHAFSVPHSYYQLDYEGTLGILNNYYGIDTFNHFVAHPKSAQRYYFNWKEMDEEEKKQEIQTGKFLKLDDYGTPEFQKLIEQFGPDQELSAFCKCEICDDNTIDTMLADYDYTHLNERAHEILSYSLEAEKVRSKISSGSAEEYINSKEYPRRFIY